ncbi:hypothetical protein [Paractinoplanes globisporus]|uniref:Uncharacterized protein n=1 Tax=Paractinoplanes globisporus TaxID=113565 RepID=A0ABW6WKH8_9ACTN|nr:hypothetical protein [Actinoplanes globisporus]
MLSHDLLRGLKPAATLIEKTKDVDVANLTDEEFAQVDDTLTQIIGDDIRIRSRLNK